MVGSAEGPASVWVEGSPIGQRVVVERQFQDCRLEQEIILWDGVARVDLTTRLHDYRGQDRLFRIRFPVAVDGGAPISEVGNAVVGRGFGTPNVDVGDVPFTLDNPAYDWFGLGATARVALRDADGGEPYASTAIGIAELIVPHDPSLDDDVRRLSIALVRKGVTSSVAPRRPSLRRDVHRLDLPDVRIAIGGPSDNRFVAELLEASGSDYRDAFERQLTAGGGARVWIPASPGSGRQEGFPDLRGVRDLPVLVVAGNVGAIADDLEDAVIDVMQPRGLGDTGATGMVEDYTVAVLNRGAARVQRRARWKPLPVAAPLVQRLAVRRLDRPPQRSAPMARTSSSSIGATRSTMP